MNVSELFSHFSGGFEKYDDEIETNVEKNRLFRSMRKQQGRIPEFEKTRGESMKKTSNHLRMTKNLKGDFLQTQIPKTAMESKHI